jgi:hypothetical protein
MMYSYAEKMDFLGVVNFQTCPKKNWDFFFKSFKCNPYNELHNILQGE